MITSDAIIENHSKPLMSRIYGKKNTANIIMYPYLQYFYIINGNYVFINGRALNGAIAAIIIHAIINKALIIPSGEKAAEIMLTIATAARIHKQTNSTIVITCEVRLSGAIAEMKFT